MDSGLFKKVKVGFTFLLLGAILLFILQNVATTELTFLVWSFSLPRAVLVLGVLCCGTILGWLLRGLWGKDRDRTAGRT